MSERPLVIDTDCGSDDAMAILAALGESGRHACRLVGITCCFGNTTIDHVCQNVLRVLKTCGEEEIPVYRGSEGPLVRHPDQPEIVHGYDGFGDCAYLFPMREGKGLEELPAPAALSVLSRAHPSLTLVSLGPLTNVALAHRLDSGFTARLDRIVCLGGNYKGIGNTTESAEFNFYSDPESANIVLTEAECPVQMVPWETILEHEIPWDEFESLMTTPTEKARLLRGATAVVAEVCHQEKFPGFLDCDLLAVAAALSSRCITSSFRSSASVECAAGALTRGMVVCQKSPSHGKKNVEIVVKFDDSFLNRLRKEMVV